MQFVCKVLLRRHSHHAPGCKGVAYQQISYALSLHMRGKVYGFSVQHVPLKPSSGQLIPGVVSQKHVSHNFYHRHDSVYRDYYMGVSLSPDLSARDSNIGPRACPRSDIGRGLIDRVMTKNPCYDLFII